MAHQVGRRLTPPSVCAVVLNACRSDESRGQVNVNNSNFPPHPNSGKLSLTRVRTGVEKRSADQISDIVLRSNDDGSNLTVGDVGTIFQNSVLGYPNYAVQDNQLIFDAMDNSNNRVIGITDLNSDKITPTGDAAVFISGGFFEARWGIWFASGTRVLSGTEEILLDDSKLSVYPNPTTGNLNLEVELQGAQEVQVILLDMLGRQLMQETYEGGSGKWSREMTLPEQLADGTYLLRIKAGEESGMIKIMKN